jgi:uncharacterized protein YkwD
VSIRLSVGTFLLLGFLVTPSALVHAQATPPTSSQSFEETLVALTNDDRVGQGVPQLTENALLSTAAQEKADDMAEKGYFSHYSPLGTSPWYWFTAVGYYYTHAGENLAINFDTPTSVEAAWMASPTHRANIVRNLYTQVGIGIAHGMYLGKPTTFIVELFATPAATLTKADEPTPTLAVNL